MSAQISYAFRWTDRNGAINGIQAGAVPLEDIEARQAAWFGLLRSAILLGWTPVRWWQWWRKNDQPKDCLPPADIMPTIRGKNVSHLDP